MPTSNVPIIAVDGKLSGAADIYSAEFADLGSTATITAHTVTLASGSGATVEATDTSGQFVRARISGGTPGVTIEALYSATTSDSRTLQCWLLIPVIAAP